MTHATPRHTLQRLLACCTLAFALVMLCTVARADDVKIGGFWIPNVSIQEIRDGRIYYYTATGEPVNRPIEDLSAIKMRTYPKLGEGQDAMDRGDHVEALRAFQAVMNQGPDGWLSQWVRAKLVTVYDELGRATDAVRTYADLIDDEAPTALLLNPPVKSIGKVSDTDKQRIVDYLEPVADVSESREVQAAVARLIREASVASAPVDSGQQTSPSVTTPTTTAPSITATTGKADIVIPEIVKRNPDAVVGLLQKGDYQGALDEADRQLAGRTAGLVFKLLYERGLALLALADESGDRKQYLEAGVSFMQVVIYSPRSVYAGPALVEAGYVHSKINRPDIAARLYDNATNVIDEQEEAALYARLESLKENLTQSP